MSERETPQILEFDSVTSTQDIARSLLRSGSCPDIVLAKMQTAGRGRCGRTWCSPSGGMYATLMLTADTLLAARAAIATKRALRETGLDASIKWPNDLLVDEKKVAGLLIEVVGDRALIGVGINIDASPIPGAAHVASYVDPPPSPRTMAVLVWKSWPQGHAEAVLAEYRQECATLGRWIQVSRGSDPGTRIAGVATDIDGTGALIVACGGHDTQSAVTVTCGDCTHLEACPGRSVASRDGSA